MVALFIIFAIMLLIVSSIAVTKEHRVRKHVVDCLISGLPKECRSPAASMHVHRIQSPVFNNGKCTITMFCDTMNDKSTVVLSNDEATTMYGKLYV